MSRILLPLVSLWLALISLLTLSSVAPDLVTRQALFFLVGFVTFFLASKTVARHWLLYKPVSLFLYGLLILTLLGLLIYGQATRGITAWIPLFAGLKFQPSQFAVVIVALLLSFFWQTFEFTQLKTMVKVIMIVLLPGLLIVLQPDLGSAVIYFVSLSVLLLFKAPSWRFLGPLLLIGLVSLSLVWQFGLKSYQKERFYSFLKMHQVSNYMKGYSADEASGYNARQALIAVGSGEIFGRGLGFGVQSHLKFLPERQTDFIFASLAEEWGLIGSLIVLGLYAVLCWQLWILLTKLGPSSQRQFTAIVLLMFFSHVFINVGMNLGLLPITGITLPFLSYGGSSILSFMISLGIVHGFCLSQHDLTNSACI